MKKAKWAAIGIALLIAVSPPAKAETTTTFTPKTGTNYVIRNVETGLFLSCSSHSAKAAYFGSKIEDNYYLLFSSLFWGQKVNCLEISK